MRLCSRGTDQQLDSELSRLLKNALANHRPPAGSRAKLLENAAKLEADIYYETGTLRKLELVIRSLRHQSWMTGDYQLGQDIKHSYLAGVAHISIA